MYQNPHKERIGYLTSAFLSMDCEVFFFPEINEEFMKIIAENIRMHKKNTLQAFFDLNMENFMRINGCTCHCKNESWWIGLPAKEYTDKDGNKKWQPVIEIPKERLEKLRDLILPEIKAEIAKQEAAAGKPPSGWAGGEVPNDDLSEIGGDCPF